MNTNRTFPRLALACLFSFLSFLRPSSADTYVWEVYDDFSGSTIDANKWDMAYFAGGNEASIENGRAKLSGIAYYSGSPTKAPDALMTAVQGSTEGNAALLIKDTNVYGLEVDLTLPQSGNSYEAGVFIDIMDTSPLGGIGPEIRYESDGTNLEYDFLNLAGAEESGSVNASLDTTHKVAIVKKEGITAYYLDGQLVKEFANTSHDADYWMAGAFNDDGKPFVAYVDNARVLRRVSTTSLDGSILAIDSEDPVKVTLVFENGTFASTFEDPGDEGTITRTDQSYVLDQTSSSAWTITMPDGEFYSFDESTGTGSLTDYSNGQIDTSGSWNFTFTRHDWEDYDDFSDNSLDAAKWQTGYWSGGKVPVEKNGRIEFTGTTVSEFNEVKVPSWAEQVSSNAKSELIDSSANSVLGFSDNNLSGIEFNIMVPSSAPSDTGVGLYAIETDALNGSLSEEARDNAIRLWADMWYSSGVPTLEFGIPGQTPVDVSCAFDTDYKVGVVFGDSTTTFYLNGERKAEFNDSSNKDYFFIRGCSEYSKPFTAYLDNVRVLRRVQTSTPPQATTVVSTPDGKPVVVQVGDVYKWNDSLDGVTLWGVGQDGNEWSPVTAKFVGGNILYGFDLQDDVEDTQNNKVTYVIDENGYIKSLEHDGEYQYYNAVSVESGVIGTIQNDQGLESVADNGTNIVDQWFFTTKTAAEEYYYSKAGYPNPKGWLWFDQYPWVYSDEEKGWLYFRPSGDKLHYWSYKYKTWQEYAPK